MSDVAVTWAKAQTAPSPLAKQVLIHAASYADARGSVWVALSVLAFEMQVNERTVQRGLAQLRKGELLQPTGEWETYKGKRYPIYRMPLDRGPANSLQAMRDAASWGDSAVTPTDARGDGAVTPSAAWGDKGVTPRGDSAVTQIGKETGKGCSEEHSKSSACAGETPGQEADGGFAEAMAAYPDSGQARTDLPAARIAWGDVVAEVGREAATAAVRRYAAEDRDLKRGDHGAPAFDRWLAKERWRRWLPRGGAAAQAVARTPFDGPAEVLAEIRASTTRPDWAESLLDGASWRAADRTVLTRTGFAAKALADEIGYRRLQSLNLRFERAPSPPFQGGGA